MLQKDPFSQGRGRAQSRAPCFAKFLTMLFVGAIMPREGRLDDGQAVTTELAMTPRSRQQAQREQEEACAQTFLDWLASQRGRSYELSRAEDSSALTGRWDFVAGERGCASWLALEVKRLVVPQSRRQFGSWSKFCERLTEDLQRHQVVQGAFTIMPAIPWTFTQRQGNTMIQVIGKALAEVTTNMGVGEEVNLGPAIASRFGDWPTKPATSDQTLWHKQGIYKVVHPAEDLFLFKLGEGGCCVEILGSVGQVFVVDPALDRAVLGIFDSERGKGAKPNEQLREARQKGASETILLLDSHIAWRPDSVEETLTSIDQSLFSNMDGVYLVSATDNRIQKVWPSV